MRAIVTDADVLGGAHVHRRYEDGETPDRVG
jgi:hypothetical protein